MRITPLTAPALLSMYAVAVGSEQGDPATAATQAVGQELLAELVAAFESERNARSALSEARARQFRALKALKDEGVSMDRVAHRLERSRGQVPTLKARRRLAASLRKKLSRAGVTHRHVIQPGIGRSDEAAPVASTNQPTKEPPTMPAPKLIKRTTTTTEEFADDLDEADGLDGLEDDDEHESDDRKATDEDDESRSRRRK